MGLTQARVPLSTVNGHVIRKHHLARPSTDSIPAIADDLCGLHATSEVTPFLSLFNRIRGFSPDDLERELYVKKRLVRVRAMRGTFFLVSQDLLPVFLRATRVRDDDIRRSLRSWGISVQEFRQLSRLIMRTLSDGPKTAPEIKRDAGPSLVRGLSRRVGWRLIKRSNLTHVLNLLVRQNKLWSQTEKIDWHGLDWDGYGSRKFGFIVRVTYGPARARSNGGSILEAKTELAHMYVRRYGPVTIEDIAWWIAESASSVRNLLRPLSGELNDIAVEGLPGSYLMDRTDFQEMKELSEEPSTIRFLPYEDPYTKGFKLKQRFIAPTAQRLVYPMGNALPTVVHDGRIVGTWSIAVRRGTVSVEVGELASLSRAVKERIVEEGRRLGEFMTQNRSVHVSIGKERTSKWQSLARAG